MSLAQVARAGAIVDLAGLLETGEVDGVGVDFLSWGFYAPKPWRNWLHTHSFHEVCLAYAGEGTFTVDGTAHPVTAGDVFIARPGDVHEIISSREAPLGIAFWGVALQRPMDPGAGGSGIGERGWWSGLTRADGPLVSRSLGTLPEVVVALAEEAATPRSGYRARLQALGTMLVLETARAFASDADLAIGAVPADRTTPAVAAMDRYLADNLERPLRVRDVAAVVHLSERHAARMFAGHTGVPIMARLRALRLERAARLLLETQEPIGQIARACGYPEIRAFITAFRRAHGQAPGAFRRNRGTWHLDAEEDAGR
ncbi:AraC family transcriptional regulator [Brachybacterium phenoliresistens]|uniref:AraC family transcriptional regulator n=1 Tax=Brachybacterium phenoliresistens TaxID=396014 RepID=UPI0031D881A0